MSVLTAKAPASPLLRGWSMGTASNLNAALDARAEKSAAEVVFDRARFLANVDGNVELLREFAQLFLDDCPRQLSALHDALARGDSRGVESAAHILKGSAGYIGAAGVFAAADELETIARCGDLAHADRACAKLHDAAVHLLRVLVDLTRLSA